ncbi:hypothetical protein BH11MYX4_BH11MYX4_00320 [soil metagenome]
MIDIVFTLVVVLLLALITGMLTLRFPRPMRPYVWIALAEYLFCAAAQLYYSRVVVQGGDTMIYAQIGGDLSKFLDSNFSWSWRELLAMLFQQPSAFDTLIDSPQSNTASMFAAVAWLLFFLRGATTAAHVLVAGLAMLGALGIYRACQDACPEASPKPLFVATVLFPSVAFWTAALHKEAFGIMGIGALLAGWRCIYQRRLAALLWVPLGVALIVLFRAPALPPVVLGLVVFLAWDRMQKLRGANVVLLGPVYLAVGLGILAVAMIVVSRVSPTLGLDQLAETVATKQQGWTLSRGGSSFDETQDQAPQTLSGQLVRFPIALLNSLFRPQFFDVNNFGALISAIEMTFITVMLINAVRRRGPGGFFIAIQRSPFLMMCSVVTLVGCTFVGLVTLNFGSLARYRVPFLPFYGALVMTLAARTAKAASPVASRTAATPLRRALAAKRLRDQRT